MAASLMKPPRRSNVSGGELVKALANLKDALQESDFDKRVALEEKMDEILMKGEMPPEFASCGRDADHSYGLPSINEEALEMFAGYVARQAWKSGCAKNCEECFKALVQSEEEETLPTQTWIQRRSHGFLLTPSRPLYTLLRSQVVDQHTMKTDILMGEFFEFSKFISL